jgi:hypothetical protein
MHELGSWLRTLDVRPTMREVMAGALARFLDELDGATPAPALRSTR